jgi:very-short-patch-repair endonuclease
MPLIQTTPELWEKLKPLAREMRQTPTPAESALWQLLRNRRVTGAKFRRQHAIERFIVDFICLEHKLIIEVDGEIHQHQQDYDTVRQAFLEYQGFCVLRFSNEAVLETPSHVIAAIESKLLGK